MPYAKQLKYKYRWHGMFTGDRVERTVERLKF